MVLDHSSSLREQSRLGAGSRDLRVTVNELGTRLARPDCAASDINEQQQSFSIACRHRSCGNMALPWA